MNLVVDVDTRVIGSDVPGQSGVTATWRDQFYVLVRFVRGGRSVDLGGGTAGTRVAVKKRGDQAGVFLAASDVGGVRKLGAGDGARYSFWLNLNTVAVATAFVTSGGETLDAVLEVEFFSGGQRRTSKPLSLPILNDYIRGDEEAPVAAVEGMEAELPFAMGANARFVAVDTGVERGVKLQIRGAADVWMDQVGWTEAY